MCMIGIWERCRRVLLQLDALHLDGNGEELGALAYIGDCGQDKQNRFLVQNRRRLRCLDYDVDVYVSCTE